MDLLSRNKYDKYINGYRKFYCYVERLFLIIFPVADLTVQVIRFHYSVIVKIRQTHLWSIPGIHNKQKKRLKFIAIVTL